MRTQKQQWITLRSLGGRFVVSLPARSRRRKRYNSWWTVVK